MTKRQKELFDIAKRQPELILTNTNDLWLEFAKEYIKIKDSNDNIVPFVPKPFQRRLLESYFRSKREKRQFRVLVSKARQVGSSTMSIVLLCVEMLLRPNIEVLIGANLKDGAGQNLWQKAAFIFRNLPMYEKKQASAPFAPGGLPSMDTMILKNNKSKMRMVGERIEVGSTFTHILVSECAHYHKFGEVMKHLLPSVKRGEDKCVILESTSVSFGDDWHELYQHAEQDMNDDGWEAFFTPWFEDPDYRATIPEAKREAFLKDIGRNTKLYGDEMSLMKDHNLTPEQLYWRRRTIDDDCKGVLQTFFMNYPCTAAESFQGAEKPLFDIRSLNWHKEKCVPPIALGQMEVHGVMGSRPSGRPDEAVFTETPQGVIEIFEEPLEFQEYVWACDMAEGVPSGDFSVALIAKRNPFEVVAKMRGTDTTKLQIVDFSRQLAYLLDYYGRPRGLVENNNHGHALLSLFSDWGYQDTLMQEVEVKDHLNPRAAKYGVTMNAQFKRQLFDYLIDAVRVRDGVRVSKYAPIINDIDTVNELYHIITDGKKIQARRKGERRAPGSNAAGFHDDLAMTLGLLVIAQKSLPEPMTKEENMVKKLGRHHPMTESLDWVKIHDPIGDLNAPIEEQYIGW